MIGAAKKYGFLTVDHHASGRRRGSSFLSQMFCNPLRHKSGCWQTDGDRLISTYDEQCADKSESIMLFDSRSWNNYSFEGRFSFISKSAHSVEGGIILYLRHGGSKNNLSIHFCLNKHSVELWQCADGDWSICGEEINHIFELERQYVFSISRDDGLYSCAIDGETLLCSSNHKIKSGHVGIAAKYCSAVFSNIHLCRRD